MKKNLTGNHNSRKMHKFPLKYILNKIEMIDFLMEFFMVISIGFPGTVGATFVSGKVADIKMS